MLILQYNISLCMFQTSDYLSKCPPCSLQTWNACLNVMRSDLDKHEAFLQQIGWQKNLDFIGIKFQFREARFLRRCFREAAYKFAVIEESKIVCYDGTQKLCLISLKSNWYRLPNVLRQSRMRRTTIDVARGAKRVMPSHKCLAYLVILSFCALRTKYCYSLKIKRLDPKMTAQNTSTILRESFL